MRYRCLLAVTLLVAQIHGLPLMRNMVMTHLNIVMTLHGLMDHIDEQELADNEESSVARMTQFHKEGSPG